jgi:hypothetical protein
MAKCTVQLILDRPDGLYSMGEKVTGKVQILVDKDVSCKKLRLRREWRTSGRGNRASGGRVDMVLFTGEWRAGSEHTYPFEFDAPPGPVTQQGKLINVHWSLEARADIPWALDPKSERAFHLMPGPVSHVDLGPNYAPTTLDLSKMHGGGCLSLLGGISVGIGLALLLPTLFFLIDYGETLFDVQELVSAGFLLVGLLMLFFGIRNRLAARKLGDFKVSLEPNIIRIGEPLVCSVVFTPRSSIRFNHVTATVRGTEVAVSGSGKHQTTHSNKFFENRVALSGAVEVPGGKETRLESILPLPENGLSTFTAPANTIAWEVVLHLDIHRWPDWKKNIPFTVVP